MAFRRYGALKTGGVSKISDFPASSVNISKTVADTAKVTGADLTGGHLCSGRLGLMAIDVMGPLE